MPKKSSLEQPAGFVVLDKQKGNTSASTLNFVKRKLDRIKIGHAGTLDPAATGLLVALVGRATKLATFVESASKTYTGTINFGYSSDTLDLDGEVTEHDANVQIDLKDIRKVIAEKLTGKISQIPPKYSALKVAGKRAYDLARNNQEFELKSREVELSNFTVEQTKHNQISFSLDASKGTYIRTVAFDLGEYLGIPALLSDLRRTRIGNYNVSDAIIPDEISYSDIIHWSELFPDAPRLEVSEEQAKRFIEGNQQILKDFSSNLSDDILAKSQIIYQREGKALGLLLNDAKTIAFGFWSN